MAGAAAAAACALLPVSRAGAEPDRAAVDTQCAWGRLADGHGRLVRCLTSDEAARLREPPPSPAAQAPAASPPAESAPKPPPAAAVAPAEPSGKTATDSSVIWPLPSPSKPPAVEPGAPPAPPPVVDEYTAELGPVVADSGALSDAQPKLRKMRDKLAECVAKNGGLAGEKAEVEVRFLVQERGRAEGVSVKKKRGVGDTAAKCVADVVDRRFVGYPDSPAVGATLAVTFTKKKK